MTVYPLPEMGSRAVSDTSLPQIARAMSRASIGFSAITSLFISVLLFSFQQQLPSGCTVEFHYLVALVHPKKLVLLEVLRTLSMSAALAPVSWMMLLLSTSPIASR